MFLEDTFTGLFLGVISQILLYTFFRGFIQHYWLKHFVSEWLILLLFS